MKYDEMNQDEQLEKIYDNMMTYHDMEKNHRRNKRACKLEKKRGRKHGYN